MSGTAALRRALAGVGGTLAESLAEPPAGDERADGPPQLAAAGPRASGRAGEYELLLEMILEGAALHYGVPRVVAVEDPDLALLLGDQLYALGLERLAALEDLEAVAELGDLISLLAQAHVRADDALAAAVWEAGAVALGWGSDPSLRRAQGLARAEDVTATQALRAAAAARKAELADGPATGPRSPDASGSPHGNL